MRRGVIVATAAAVVAGLAVAGVLLVRGRGSEAVADCYSGTGTTADGQRLAATMRLTLDGHAVAGTYMAGAGPAQQAVFEVRGTLDGDRFAGTFTAAGQPLAATGAMDARQVTLDGGRGFTITRFTAGC